jgi:hypothetical protein
MPTITSKTIAEYLDHIQWGYRVLDDTTLLTGFRGAVPFYSYTAPLEILTGPHWVYLRGLLQLDVRPDYRPGVLRFITQWNERCHLARFLLVRGCVLIQSEIPTVQCHEGAFRDALAAVCRYGSLTGAEISVLATNRSANELYEAASTALEAADQSRVATGLFDAGQAEEFELVFNTIPE